MSQAVTRTKPESRGLPSPTLIAFLFLLAAAAAGAVWLAQQLSDPAALPIRRVQIEGEFLHLEPARLQDIVERSVDAGFFGVDVARVRARLLDEPWIREATIHRVWPDTLRVSVVEQVPVARWGTEMLLNENGDIFAPSPESIPQGFVQFDGPLGLELDILNRYRAMSPRFVELGLAIEKIRLSARHAWTVYLDGGQEIELGRRDVDVRLNRFLLAYRAGLTDIWADIGRIDLRYPNGFAVSQRGYVPGHG